MLFLKAVNFNLSKSQENPEGARKTFSQKKLFCVLQGAVAVIRVTLPSVAEGQRSFSKKHKNKETGCSLFENLGDGKKVENQVFRLEKSPVRKRCVVFYALNCMVAGLRFQN